MPYAHVNGIDLYYESHGKGPCVVFAHGQGGNHLSFWQQVPHFRDRFRCITFDHRAFGLSKDLTGEGRVWWARDLEALLKQLGEDSCAIIAHSMGGRTAIGLTFRTAVKVWGIVFSGTNGGAVTPESREIQARFRETIPEGSTLLDRALDDRFAAEQPGMAFLYRQIQRLNPKRPPDFLAPIPGYLGTTSDRLRESGIPVLFLAGADDKVVPASALAACHRGLPGSRYHEIPLAGHSSYFEKPGEFNAAVDDFLSAAWQQWQARAGEAYLIRS